MIRPPIIWRDVRGAVARSHIWFIEIDPTEPLSTLAEEVAEWQHKAAVFIPSGLATCIALGFAGYQVAGWFAALLAGLVGLFAGAVIGHNLRSGTRALEYWGKAVSLAAGDDLDTLAKSLSGYGQFRHAVPLETIKLKITLRRDPAEDWLARNLPALERAYAKRTLSSVPSQGDR